MNTLIFKTNINSDEEFKLVKKHLSDKKDMKECTIDLTDNDKVLRVLSDSYTVNEIEENIAEMGFYCIELDD